MLETNIGLEIKLIKTQNHKMLLVLVNLSLFGRKFTKVFQNVNKNREKPVYVQTTCKHTTCTCYSPNHESLGCVFFSPFSTEHSQGTYLHWKVILELVPKVLSCIFSTRSVFAEYLHIISECIALYNYTGEAGDLSFSEGDVINVHKDEGEWWEGSCSLGEKGLFPANYVKRKDTEVH